MDVPVIISDKFQQSVEYENVEVPQIQFIDRVSGPSSFNETGLLSAGYGGGEGFFRPFLALLRIVVELSASFRALDDEEFFVIEGSLCTISPPRMLT